MMMSTSDRQKKLHVSRSLSSKRSSSIARNPSVYSETKQRSIRNKINTIQPSNDPNTSSRASVRVHKIHRPSDCSSSTADSIKTVSSFDIHRTISQSNAGSLVSTKSNTSMKPITEISKNGSSSIEIRNIHRIKKQDENMMISTTDPSSNTSSSDLFSTHGSISSIQFNHVPKSIHVFYQKHHKRFESQKQNNEAGDDRKCRRRRKVFFCTRCCCYCCMVSILASIFLAGLIAAITVIVLHSEAGNPIASIFNKTSTSITPTTIAMVMITSTFTTSTKSIISTNSTTSSSSTSTSSTTTSGLTSSLTSSTTFTTSTSTATTSTTATTTSTSTATATTSSTTTTTTTSAYDSCRHLQWNQTGFIVAGTGSGGSAMNQFKDPGFIYIDVNDTLYVCDHHNYRVQMWPKGANAGITIFDVGENHLDHPEGITFDKNGYMYITGHIYHRVLSFPPDFFTGTPVAGQAGTAGLANNLLNSPLGMDVDDNLNLYIAERENKRVMRWAPSASSGTVAINAGLKLYGLLLSLYTSNQVYVSSEDSNAVYLWTFGSTTPAVTLNTVNSSTTALNKPRGIKYDIYGNLYVADKANKRIVMYCANRTVGRVVVGDTGTSPSLDKPHDIAFDSEMNLYVSDEAKNSVLKFDRLYD